MTKSSSQVQSEDLLIMNYFRKLIECSLSTPLWEDQRTLNNSLYNYVYRLFMLYSDLGYTFETQVMVTTLLQIQLLCFTKY